MIKCVGEIKFTDPEFGREIETCLIGKGLLLEPIYCDKLIVGFNIYERTLGYEQK